MNDFAKLVLSGLGCSAVLFGVAAFLYRDYDPNRAPEEVTGPPPASRSIDIRADPTPSKPLPPYLALARIDAGGEPLSVNSQPALRFKSLLKQADAACVEDEEQIAGQLVFTKSVFTENGIDSKMLPMLEGVTSAIYGKSRFNFSTMLAAYTTLRVKGQSHEDAVQSLRGNAALIQDALNKPVRPERKR